jgi:hypothetical protein
LHAGLDGALAKRVGTAAYDFRHGSVSDVPKPGTAVARCWTHVSKAERLARFAPALLLRASCIVIWFYERQGEHLRYEIRQQLEGDRFALVVTLPDGSERVELFEDSTLLNRRSVELEKILRSKGWDGPFARDI